MNRIIALALVTPLFLVSCTTRKPSAAAYTEPDKEAGPAMPYQPVTAPEKHEFVNDRIDFYPDDYRKDPDAHPNTPVAWVGVVRSTDANERDIENQIFADTVFEHHYFDWVQNGVGDKIQLSVSPRGEGTFRMRWVMDKMSEESTANNAEKYAAPGNLAIVYGVPEKVEADGTIVMHYRYLRMIDHDHYNTNEFDYSRLGEPFHTLRPGNSTNGLTASATH